MAASFALFMIISTFWKLISSRYNLSLAVTNFVGNWHLIRRDGRVDKVKLLVNHPRVYGKTIL